MYLILGTHCKTVVFLEIHCAARWNMCNHPYFRIRRFFIGDPYLRHCSYKLVGFAYVYWASICIMYIVYAIMYILFYIEFTVLLCKNTVKTACFSEINRIIKFSIVIILILPKNTLSYIHLFFLQSLHYICECGKIRIRTAT